MDVTIFLAKLVGLYSLFLGLIFLFRKRQVQTYFREIISSKGTLAMTGMFNVVFGLALIILSSWSWDYRLLITLFGYLMLLRGLLCLIFPIYMQRFSLNMITRGYTVIITVQLVLGVLLTYAGFAYSQVQY